MDKELLIEVIKYTDGWVIVVAILLFVIRDIYKTYSANSSQNRTLRILEDTIKSILENISHNILTLTSKLDEFLSREH